MSAQATFGAVKSSLRVPVALEGALSAVGRELSAFVVPLICDPPQCQSIVDASVVHAHLKGLKLADYSTGEDDMIVDILVGSDQYWQLVSGKVLQGENRPTAIQTRLGWVLSGPTNGTVQNDQQQNNLVTTHVLKMASKPVDITNESLDGSLQRFWDIGCQTKNCV